MKLDDFEKLIENIDIEVFKQVIKFYTPMEPIESYDFHYPWSTGEPIHVCPNCIERLSMASLRKKTCIKCWKPLIINEALLDET